MTRWSAEAATVAMRAAGLEPLVPYPGMASPWRCRCTTCGHEVTPRCSTIRKGWGGCRFCANAARNARRLTETATQAVEEMRAADLEPKGAYPGAAKRWPCTCTRCGQACTVTLNSVRRGQRGCPTCSLTLRAARTLAAHADEAVAVMRAAGLEPLVPYLGTSEPWLCRCTVCGRETSPRHLSVRRGHGGCKFCTGWTIAPEVAAERMRAAGIDPLTPYPGASTPWPSRCTTCGADVNPTYDAVVTRSTQGCRACTGSTR